MLCRSRGGRQGQSRILFSGDKAEDLSRPRADKRLHTGAAAEACQGNCRLLAEPLCAEQTGP